MESCRRNKKGAKIMYKIIIVLKDCFVYEITCNDYFVDFNDRYIKLINEQHFTRKFYFKSIKELFIVDYEFGHVHEIKL